MVKNSKKTREIYRENKQKTLKMRKKLKFHRIGPNFLSLFPNVSKVCEENPSRFFFAKLKEFEKNS